MDPEVILYKNERSRLWVLILPTWAMPSGCTPWVGLGFSLPPGANSWFPHQALWEDANPGVGRQAGLDWGRGVEMLGTFPVMVAEVLVLAAACAE